MQTKIDEKQQNIVEMFNDIAPKYDITNRIISGGSDIGWRRLGCESAISLVDKSGMRILDLATGTGDMLLFWMEAAKKLNHKIGTLVGIDPAEKMLKIAKKKVPEADFYVGFAQDIPASDASADILSISYGFRNVVQKEKAVQEFVRVLNTSGVLCILEFTRPQNQTLFKKIAQWYVRNILPYIGGLISGNYAAYKYLPNSIDGFLSLSEICELLEQNGFEIMLTKSFSFDICSLIIAQKQ